jgi:hypothetical protein
MGREWHVNADDTTKRVEDALHKAGLPMVALASAAPPL